MTHTMQNYNGDIVFPFYRILKKFDVEAKHVTPESDYKKDLGFNEDDWNIFLLYLEQRYNITISEKAEKQIDSIKTTLDYLEKRVSA